MTLAAIALAANMVIMPMDCPQVRALVQHYGKVAAISWAMKQIYLGTYSWKEYRAAKRCLKE